MNVFVYISSLNLGAVSIFGAVLHTHVCSTPVPQVTTEGCLLYRRQLFFLPNLGELNFVLLARPKLDFVVVVKLDLKPAFRGNDL